MPEQSKFENVDVTASLEAIMKQNTGFYQSDLEIDKEIIAKAAASPRKEDKTLLWFCRPSGTHCFRERDVFLKDTAPHNTWRFYMEQTSDRVLAYAIELTGSGNGRNRDAERTGYILNCYMFHHDVFIKIHSSFKIVDANTAPTALVRDSSSRVS